MRFGFYLPNSGPTAEPDSLAEIARQGDKLGFNCMVAPDHIIEPKQIDSTYPYSVSGAFGGATRSDGEWPEQLTTLAFLAGVTENIRLVTSVMIVPYRNPILTAKMLATIDMLSKGRLTVGVGVGWMEEEFNALGLADQFPIRGRITDEWMKICIEAWTSDGPATFEGEHRQFERVGGMVGCVQEPHIPIWVGGKGPIAARRVARYATGYHTISSTPAEVAAEIKIVNDEVERQGRDPAEIEVSMLGPMVLLDGDPASVRGFPAVAGGSADQIVETLGQYAEAGLHHALTLPTFSTPAWDITPQQHHEAMQQLAEEIIPALR
jgi:probable F420-dependent oxidoreductase